MQSAYKKLVGLYAPRKSAATKNTEKQYIKLQQQNSSPS